MKKILLLISLICISTFAFSQSISGVINNYTQVLGFGSSSCSAEITVDDGSAFSPGDSVLIIQMKGATADVTNTNSFGDLTAIGSAGKYEKAEIALTTGNVISLSNQLVNTYDENLSVQMVSVPHYSANVTITGTLTALPWDGTTGGVLAFTVDGTITMNADIDVSGLGFSGGVDLKLGPSASIASGASCFAGTQGCVGTDYFYADPSTYAVEKGEGLVFDKFGIELGRGKLINAGGGGGMSYGGGGGGSNFGAGGAGGGCNDNECGVLCTPCNEGLSAGLGGQNLAAQYNNVQNRIFFGGGGGSGNHGNSSVNYFNLQHRNGTPGGGIVLIKADQIIGNGFTVTAAGADGVISPSVQTGGTGGGGGGGTVLLHTALANLSLNVDVSGGRGNDANISSSASTTAGAGGGGGGGVLWTNIASPGITLDATAGVAGISRNTSGVVGATWQGASGSSGGSLTGLAVPEGSIPTGSGDTAFVASVAGLDTLMLCEGQSYPIFLYAEGDNFQWQIDSTGTGVWENLVDGPNYTNVDSNTNFIIVNVDTSMDDNRYRLVAYTACDSAISGTFYLSVFGNPIITTQPQSQTSCIGGDALFYIEAEDAVSYQWQQIAPVPGNISDNATFSGSNTDSLSLTNIPASLNSSIYRVQVTNACGSVFSSPAFLNFTTNPIVIDDISGSVEVCEGNDSMMYVAYTGNVDSIRWQVNSGSGFTDLSNGAFHQGVDQDTLLLNNVPFSFNGNVYRVILSNDCGTTATSVSIDLTVSELNITAYNFIGCEGQNLSISSTPSGTNITFQWQIDTSGVWEDLTNAGPYSNTDSVNLVIDGSIVDPSLDSNDYRVIINTDCGSDTSIAISSTITPSPTFNIQPVNDTVCPGDTAIFSVAVTGGVSYQWQSNEFGSFSNVFNGANYSGANSPTLSVFNVTPALDGVVYRVRVQGTFPCGLASSTNAQLTIGGDAVDVTTQSMDLNFCPRIDSFIYANYTGTPDTIFWEVNTGAGFNYASTGGLSGFNGSDTLSFIDMDPSLDGNIYRAIIANACGESDTSANITLNLFEAVNVSSSPNEVVCEGDSAIFYVSTTGAVASTQWQLFNGSVYVDIVPSATYQVSSTGDTLVITSTSLAMDGDIFNFQATDSCGNVVDGTAMNLNVNESYDLTTALILCSSDSLVLSDGTVVTTAGTYRDTIATGTINGCDSIIEYDLTFHPLVTSNDSVVLCFGDSLQLSDGSYVNATGIYNDTLAGAAATGCDSIHIIDLTISPQVTGNDTQVLCFGDSLMLSDGSYVNTTGTYNDTIVGGAANTCDSVVIIDLTISPLVSGNDVQELCFGDSLMLSDGSYVNATGTYNDTLVGSAASGCDSINIIDLTVLPLASETLVDSFCSGGTYTLASGAVVDSAGSYSDTLFAASVNGCDSVITYNLNIQTIPAPDTTITDTLCTGDTYTFPSGLTTTTPGIYNDTISAANGCDSIVRFDIQSGPTTSFTQQFDDLNACVGTNVLYYLITPDSTVSYQWMIDGVDLPGETTDSLLLSSVSFANDSNVVQLRVMGRCDTVVSDTSYLTIKDQGVVDLDPADMTVCEGDSAGFAVSTDIPVFGYAWYENGVAIPGANDSTYSIPVTTFAQDSNEYFVVIVDSCNLRDSSAIAYLTVTRIIDSTTNTICFGDSMMLSDGSFINTTGVYNDTIVGGAASGCDSIVIIDLTISPLVTSNDTQVLCFGDSLMLSDGSYVNTSGIYNDTLSGASSSGCDSINIINLTISPQITGNDTQVLCFGDSLMLSDGSFVNATGTYNDTIVGGAGNGCDSVNIIDLTISPQVTGNDTQVLCFGDSLMLSDGSFVNATGTYNDTIVGGAGNGCDSVNIIDLTISPQVTGNDTQILCFGDSLMLSDGSFVNTTGTYNDTIIGGAGNGCDSVNIIDLTISPQITGNDTLVLCFGDSLMLSDGSFVNATGTYNDTIVGGAGNGCDSVNVIDLTISPLPTANDTQVLCFGDSLMLSDGSFVNATGIYNDTIVGGAASGCDSLNIVDLTISPLVTSNDSLVLCFGDSLQLSDGSYVNATGIYNDTLVAGSSSGCDSINIIDLTISPLVTSNDTQVLCFGDSLQLSDGSFVNATGTYNDTLVAGSTSGCDSIHIIDLTISPQITGNDTQVLCFGDSLMLSDGSFVNATGTYNDTIVGGAGNGCDSVAIIDLTISPLVTGNDTQVLCFGDSLMLSDGSFANTTGTYNDTLVAITADGCDSVNIINLTILPLAAETVVDSFCSGGSYTLASGAVVDSAGSYNDTLVAASFNGCDSVITYNLNIQMIPAPDTTIVDTLCAGDTYTFPSGSTTNTPGIYNDTISAANGCDSIVRFDIQSGPTTSFTQQFADLDVCAGTNVLYYLITPDSTVSYQWMIDGVDLPGETTDSLLISNVSFANDSNVVQLRVMGRCDTVVSDTSILTVIDQGVVVNDPADMTVCEGDSAGFTVSTSEPVFGYIWYENGVAVSNDSTYSIPVTTFAQDSNEYFVVVIDSCNLRDTSAIAFLTVTRIIDSTTNTICFGDSMMLSDGSFINATGVYNDTIVGGSVSGCDSIVIIDLTVSPLVTSNDTQVLCFGDSLQLSDGSFVNASGIYNDTLVAGSNSGCDSINIINLTISPQITGNDTQVLCFGDSLMLSDGSFASATGTYNDTIVGGAGNGCDSVNIIDLTISPQITGNDTQVLCFGDSLMLSDGSFVNATGTYNDTIVGGAGNGCDSLNIIDLTISPLPTANDTQVLCFGDSLQLSDGSFVNASGIYNDTIAGGAASGCDSLNIVDLTISPLVTSNDTQVLCFGDSLQLSDGSFVNATGIYNDTIVGGAGSGCDSINIIDLTIAPLVTSNDTQVLCFGDSLQLSDGSFVNATGIYNDTLAGGAGSGCDSIHIIDLTISPLVTSNDTQVLCFGDSLQLSDGSFVNATGIYNDTLVAGSSNGCDSINIIDLTISPLVTSNDTQVLCFGDSLQLSDGSFVNATGTYNDTLVAGALSGCDSINIIDLTISPQITGNDTQVLCFGDSLMLSDGSFASATGTYNDTIIGGAGNGCDSVNIIDLTISPQVTGNDTQVLCFGDSLMLSDGSFVNATGTYNDTIIGGAGNGCDSVNIIDLTISPLLLGMDTQVICSGDSFQLMNGSFVNTTGTYNDTIVNGGSTGCDTIIQIDLTVLPNPTSAVVDSFCAGGDYILASGLIVDSAGLYNDTLFAGAANGCDSIINYDLRIIAAFVPSPPVEDTICFNETYTLPSGTIVSLAGIYNDTLSTATGCDSIYVVDLFVRPANNVVQQSGDQLLCIGDTASFYVESADTMATYQWILNGADIVGETNDTLTLPNVVAANDGDVVQVRIMGLCDTILNNANVLSIREIGTVTADPADMTVCAGDSAGFSITTNIPVVSYEWFENGVAIAGSNSDTYTIPATTIAQDSNVYFCAITDSCGSVDSSAIATLRVNPNAQISLQSIDRTVCAQDSTIFFVTASGANVTYQWLLNGVAIPGATNDTLSLNPVTNNMDGNVYACEVSTDCGNLATNDMALTVNDTSTFMSQSQDFTQCEGFSFDIFIDATNIATYQWQIDQGAGFVNLTDGPLGANGTQVEGATTGTLTISNYDLTISGAQFQVITTVDCGTAPIFTPVTATITSPVTITDRLEDTVVCLAEVTPIFVPYVDGAAQWDNGDFGQFFEPTVTGDYIVEFTDSNSCPQSDTIFVQVDDCIALCVVTAPTGFSPNGSGANDIFRAIYTCDLSFYELQVYNRYGELVYLTNEPLEGWDGVYKGVNAEIGTYVWYISYQKEGADRKEEVKGNVTLIR